MCPDPGFYQAVSVFMKAKIMQETDHRGESYHINLDQDLSATTHWNQSGNSPLSLALIRGVRLSNRGAINLDLKLVELGDKGPGAHRLRVEEVCGVSRLNTTRAASRPCCV